MSPCEPASLPPPGIDIASLVRQVGEANAALARYDGLLQGMANPKVILSPLTDREAVLSSRIEGAQATLAEVLEHEAGQECDPGKEADIQEILNYRQALVLTAENRAERPLRLGLVTALHQTLMDSVRGRGKEPGQFRESQNEIGRYGGASEEARHAPPGPPQLMDHLQAWEAYLATDDFDPLAQTAIMHAQFEILRPFEDGNGRIGRLLIPLFLYSKKRLSCPGFYLSAYLEANRAEYHERLAAITRKGDWTGWIAFFLRAIAQQAGKDIDLARTIAQLYEDMKNRVRDITHSQHSAQIVDALFDRPIFRIGDFARRAGIPKPTAHPLLRQLQEAGILAMLREGAGRRPAILAFPPLLNAAEGRALF